MTSTLLKNGPDVVACWVLLLASCDRNGESTMQPSAAASLLRIGDDRAKAAFAILQEPDPDSRNSEHDGRRLIRQDDGTWFVVSHQKYQWLASKARAAQRQRRYEASKKARECEAAEPVSASVQTAAPASPFAGQRAEEAVNAEIRRLQNELGAAIMKCAEHRNSRDMFPAWSRRITSWVNSEGKKFNGKPDHRVITSIDRLQKSIDDAVWWLAQLEAGPIEEGPIGKR